MTRLDTATRLWTILVVMSAALFAWAAVNLQLIMRPDVLGLIVALATTVGGLGIIRLASGRIHPLSPIAFVAYCQILIFVARPAFAMHYQDSANIFTGNEFDESMLAAQVIAGGGFLALSIGYALTFDRQHAITAKAISPFTDQQWSKMAGPLYTVVGLGYALYGIYIAQIGWSGYWSATLSGRSDELRAALNSNSGYFYSGLQFATGALLLVIFQSSLRKKTLPVVGLLILLGISTFPQIAAGSRSVFIPVIVAILYILYTVRPTILRLSRVIIWGPLLFLFGFVAPRIWRDNLAVGGSLIDSLQVAMSPENLFDNFFGGLDTAMVDAFALQIGEQNSGDLPLQLGGTYLGLFSSIIPRAFWPGKPESVDELLNSALFPETDAKGIGFAFGFYSEPFFNFGFFGVIIVSAVAGVALAALVNRANRDHDMISVFILMMVTSYIFPIMRGSLSFDSQRLLISLLPVIVVLALTRPRRPHQIHRKTAVSPDTPTLSTATAKVWVK